MIDDRKAAGASESASDYKSQRFPVDPTAICPFCGREATFGGELTFRDRAGTKWHGPFIEFACSTLIVTPAGGRRHEIWNRCSLATITLGPEDYEIREGVEKPLYPSLLDVAGAAALIRYETRKAEQRAAKLSRAKVKA